MTNLTLKWWSICGQTPFGILSGLARLSSAYWLPFRSQVLHIDHHLRLKFCNIAHNLRVEFSIPCQCKESKEVNLKCLAAYFSALGELFKNTHHFSSLVQPLSLISKNILHQRSSLNNSRKFFFVCTLTKK